MRLRHAHKFVCMVTHPDFPVRAASSICASHARAPGNFDVVTRMHLYQAAGDGPSRHKRLPARGVSGVPDGERCWVADSPHWQHLSDAQRRPVAHAELARGCAPELFEQALDEIKQTVEGFVTFHWVWRGLFRIDCFIDLCCARWKYVLESS